MNHKIIPKPLLLFYCFRRIPSIGVIYSICQVVHFNIELISFMSKYENLPTHSPRVKSIYQPMVYVKNQLTNHGLLKLHGPGFCLKPRE